MRRGEAATTATKQALLALLEMHRGERLSGQALADSLGVSRAAVWKAAEALRAKGVAIEAVPGGGYRLAEGSDTLSAEGLLAHLPAGSAVRVLPEVDSTSLEAKRWALEGAPHGAIVLAEGQTGGRGRQGRSFASPPGGMYMSIVLRPHLPTADAVLVTTQAAVAACRAVQALCGLRLQIKWVNDLFYKGRKCCGILSEAGTGFEDGSLEYIVVGIGINLTTPEEAFPPELREVATSLFPGGPAPVPRAALAAAVQKELLALFATLPDRFFLEDYRARSLVLGRRVTVLAQPPYEAVALEIDESARLVVQREDGSMCALSSGEISVKLERGDA